MASQDMRIHKISFLMGQAADIDNLTTSTGHGQTNCFHKLLRLLYLLILDSVPTAMPKLKKLKLAANVKRGHTALKNVR